MTPSVSIVIRTSGMERLREILASIESQNISNCSINEIVLVNGNLSCPLDTDVFPASFEIVQLTMNQGPYRPGRALNEGMRLATGELVVFLSGHSVPLGPDWLRTLIAPFLEFEVAGVSGAQVPRHESNWIESFYRRAWYNSARVARLFGHFNLANAAIRKRFWDMCPFNEILEGCEDRHWRRTITICYGGRFVFSEEALVCHSHILSWAESLSYFLWLWKIAMSSRFLAWCRR